MDDLWNATLARQIIMLVVLVGVLVVAVRSSRLRIGTIARHASVWIAIALAIAVGFTLWPDVETLGRRMLADFLPSRGTVTGTRTVSFQAANDGHFHVEAVVDGADITLLVDTGATVVSLSRRDAARIGIDVGQLTYNQRVMTANGPALAAAVTLRELRLGPISIRDVRASVSDGRMEDSLLGMSFLGRLQSYTVSGRTLTLTGPP